MTTYKEAGVDIDAGTEAVSRIKKHVRSTFSENVLTDLVGVFNFHKVNIKSLFWCPVRMVLEQN